MSRRRARLATLVVASALAVLGGCGRIGFDTDTGAVRSQCDTAAAAPSIPRPVRPFEAGPNYRSIGTRIDPLFETGTATVRAGSRSVAFGAGPLPANVGTGDQLVVGGETLFVQSVDGPAMVTVQAAAAADHVDEVFVMRRAYATLQAWETDRQGDLVAEDRIEVGVAYDDGPFTEGLVVDGSTTDPTHFMWLTVAPGHRHAGRPRTGARIRTDGPGGADLVRVIDAYFRLHWLELDCARTGGWVGHGVLLGYRGDEAELADLLVYDGAFVAIRIADYVKGTVVRDTIVSHMAGRPAAIVASGPHAGEVAYLYNNTVFATAQQGIGAFSDLRGPFWFEAWNNVVMASGTTDFSSAVPYGCSGYNLSSDDTAPGEAAIVEPSPERVFRSTAVDTLDLHLAPSSPAIDHGVDLSFVFDADVDGEPRPAGAAWDLGADEVSGTAAR